MNDETKTAGLWERTKAWANKNRTISGALVGGAAGTIVPGLGTVVGAIVDGEPATSVRRVAPSRVRPNCS